jgi:putative DNA primase/helicase
MTLLFGANAQAYWDAGLPAIPLQYREKRPAIDAWQQYATMLPTREDQQMWLQVFGQNNIGLALGPQSGLCMIDIDTDDPVLNAIFQRLLPPSPWVRIGRKGMMKAYRFTGTKTFRIKDVTNKMIVEHLSAGTQIVLPPSVHPDTGKPYTSNEHLVAVLDRLNPLPPDIEHQLRAALTEAGINLSHSGYTKVTEWVPAGARDVSMTAVAGVFAAGVTRGECSLLEAVDRMRAWAQMNVEHVAGDNVDPEKGVQNLVRFLRRDIEEKNRILPVGWDKGLTEEDKKALGFDVKDSQEEWDFDRIKDHFKTVFETTHPDSKSRIDGVDMGLKKMGESKSLGSLDRDRLLKYVVESGGLKVTKSTLNNRLKELTKEEIDGLNHTEIAAAVIKDRLQVQMLAYVGTQFLGWNGSHWSEHSPIEGETTIEKALKRRIATEYGHLPAGRRESDHKGILKIASELIPQTICSIPKRAVNFANGMVGTDLKIEPHDHTAGMTYTLPFRYMPDLASKARKFHDFLGSCWAADPDYEQKVLALQEAMAATIFGVAPAYQRAFLLFGAPKTGKSQLLRIIECLVPDDARSYCPPDQWADKFHPATMVNSVLNVCGELSERRLIDGQRFKGIVCGEEMDVQFKGKPIFKMRPKCAHWFASNHTPKTADTSSGFTRRWLVLSFNKPVKDEERVIDIGDMIVAEEREAIAAWAMQAMPRLMAQQGYTIPASHREIMEDVANQNNSVRYFLLESNMVKREQGLVTPEMKIFNAYFGFCAGPGGLKPCSPRNFRSRMRELGTEMGFEVETKPLPGGIVEVNYLGLGLR